MKKLLPSILLTLFLIMVPCICFSQTPLKVGALIPYTGRWGDSGRECAKGMLDAAKWLNQHEGVFGKTMQNDLESGKWRQQMYETSSKSELPNKNWFFVKQFVELIDK